MSSLHLIFSLAFAMACLAGEGSAFLKGDFCSDVSFWDRITYKYEERCCGGGRIDTNCVTRTEEVCKEVTDMRCEATAWVECKPASGEGNDKACKAEYKDFQQRKCKKVPYTVPHLKKVPKCHQRTKENCVTDWEVDDNGNKVWTGKETCEPVTWEECEIVEEFVDFPAEKTECSTAANIKYVDFRAVRGNSDSLVHDCKVRKAVDCKPVKSTKCATVTYQDCRMEPSEEDNCGVTVPVPEQNKVHQKKCLT